MPWIFGWALIASLGLLSGCVDGNGARYWRLIYWLMGVVEEKSPCGSRSFGWLGSTTSSTSRLPHFTIWGAKVQKAGAKVPPTKALVWAFHFFACISTQRSVIVESHASDAMSVPMLVLGAPHFVVHSHIPVSG